MPEDGRQPMPQSVDDVWRGGVPIGELFDLHSVRSGKPQRDGLSPDGPSSGCLGLPEHEYTGEAILRDRLKTGTWVAIGYQAPRQMGTKLQILPIEFVDFAVVDFIHSGLAGDGLTFVGVRIVAGADLPSLQSERPARGRPSIQGALQDVCQSLLRRRELKPSDPVTVVVQKVWTAISETKDSRIGIISKPSPETIRQAWRTVLGSQKQ
jgi:hypothetical protein